MNFKGQHLLSTKQFDKEGLLELFVLAREFEQQYAKGELIDLARGKIMATLFFEPSTRTRFSFEAAMLRLGGQVISNEDMLNTSSLKKFESLEDTGRVVSQLVDLLVVRHPETGSVQKIAKYSQVPVLNAGDGSSEHPTQGLLDLYTIWKERGGLDGLTIGMIGDLKNGRVPHSQCHLLKHFDVRFIFVAPEALKMPVEIVQELRGMSKEVLESENFVEQIGKMDVIGMTRVQKERFIDVEEYKQYAGVYLLNKEILAQAGEKSIIIHPLPRVDEIAIEVDADPRVKYFEQVKNGMFVRMALISKVL